MNICFYEPPPLLKAGGLDQAIRSLRDYLETQGQTVTANGADTFKPNTAAVVHFHGLWQTRHLIKSRQCVRHGVPYIVSPHGMLEPWAWRHKRWKKLPYYHLLEKHHLKGAGRVLATSAQEAENLSQFIARDRVSVIPLGLTSNCRPDWAGARRRLGWTSDELVFLYLSRIHPKKGLHLLLPALLDILPSLPVSWRMVIIGEGEKRYVAECRGLAASHPAAGPHIEWKGAIWGEDKWDYYQAADLFCLPTHSENFGLACLEACQVGTRVLTTPNTPWGFLEKVGAALLVEPDVDSVKDGLKRFLQQRPWQETDRDRLSRMVFETFGWNSVGKRYLDLYAELVGANTRAGV